MEPLSKNQVEAEDFDSSRHFFFFTKTQKLGLSNLILSPIGGFLCACACARKGETHPWFTDGSLKSYTHLWRITTSLAPAAMNVCYAVQQWLKSTRKKNLRLKWSVPFCSLRLFSLYGLLYVKTCAKKAPQKRIKRKRWRLLRIRIRKKRLRNPFFVLNPEQLFKKQEWHLQTIEKSQWRLRIPRK